MTAKQKRVVLASSALLVCIIAYIAPGYLHRPRMSEQEAVRIANAAAAAEGIILSEYRAPTVHFEFGRRDRTWRVIDKWDDRHLEILRFNLRKYREKYPSPSFDYLRYLDVEPPPERF